MYSEEIKKRWEKKKKVGFWSSQHKLVKTEENYFNHR